MRYDYDMLGSRIHQASMEAGERWMLNDVAGKPLYAWDSRDHQFRTAYDHCGGPIESFLREGARAGAAGRTTVYGETRPNPEASNLRGQGDSALRSGGRRHQRRIRFQGQPAAQPAPACAESTRPTLDWSAAVPLEAEIYTSRTTLRRAQPPDSDTLTHAGQQRHSPHLQRGQSARAGRGQSARRGGRHSLCHRHRLQRQGPAHADRIRQRRQDDLRIRPADLPPDPIYAQRHARRLARSAAGRSASALHLRPGWQHHPHPRRRAADHLLPQQARRAERRLHL